jgi:hypothetical protein
MSVEDRLRAGLAREASTDGVENALETTFRRRRASLRRRIVGGIVLASAVVATVPWTVRQLGAEGTRPVTATPEPSTAFEGSWVSHLTRRQVVDQIRAAGLGKWVRPFLAHEQVRKHQTIVYSFDGGTFKVVDYQPGGGWHVGWEGTLTALPGHKIRMYDDFSGATDVYHWRRDGDRLDLERVGTDTLKVHDIPYQVYDAAYMGDWWERTDCTMRTGQDC